MRIPVVPVMLAAPLPVPENLQDEVKVTVVRVAGLHVTVIPDGAVAVSPTTVVNPLRNAAVMVTLPDPPGWKNSEVAFAVNEKSGVEGGGGPEGKMSVIGEALASLLVIVGRPQFHSIVFSHE